MEPEVAELLLTNSEVLINVLNHLKYKTDPGLCNSGIAMLEEQQLLILNLHNGPTKELI